MFSVLDQKGNYKVKKWLIHKFYDICNKHI